MRLSAALLAGLTLAGPAFAVAPAETERFEESRARELLAKLMGDQKPHPIGSPENRLVRERIERRLAELGYATELQRSFVCGEFRRNCGTVENVLARREGSERGESILLNTHYDTQPATPGAGDSMAGVAVALEVARILGAEPPPRRSVIFLFNDGEEAGLLGSTAFVREHRWAAEVVAVVNLDARGSRGDSFLAATIASDRPLIDAWAQGSSRPRGSSLVPALVGLLPNTNDLAAFDRLGAPGALIAFAGGARSYHSAADILDGLSRESLHGMGSDALAVVRALAAAERIDRVPGSTVFFSAGPWVVRWPAAWNLLLVLLGGLTAAVRAALWRRGGELTGNQFAWGLVSTLGAALAAGVGALAAEKARQFLLGDGPALVAHPGPAAAAILLGGVAAGLAVVAPLRPRAGGWGQALGVLAVLFAGGLAVSSFLPGACFLFALPLFAAAAYFLRPRWIAGAAVAAVTLGLWLDAIGRFQALFGLVAPTPLGIVLGALLGIASPLLPVRKGRWLAPAAAMAGSLVALAVVAQRPTFTADQPQFQSLLYVMRAGSGDASWTATGWPLPEAWRARFAAAYDGDPALPWSRVDSGAVSRAPAIELPGARFEVSSNEAYGALRRVRGRVLPSAGARLLQFVVPEGSRLRSIAVDGVTVPREGLVRYRIYRDGYEVIGLWSPPAEGSEVALEIEGKAPLAVELVEWSPGLPAAAEPLLAGRPIWSQPNGFGDATVVRVEMQF